MSEFSQSFFLASVIFTNLQSLFSDILKLSQCFEVILAARDGFKVTEGLVV
jgi:hypothetical protein